MLELREIYERLVGDSTPKQRAALAAERSVAVRAVAGAGKTRALALRYVQYLLCGDGEGGDSLAPRQVAAITFTRKAAGELRSRVDRYLGEAEAMAASAGRGAAREHIIAAREGLIEAPIGTIHSFCATLLREHAFYAGLDPEFTVLDARDAGETYDLVRERFWRDLSAEPVNSPRRAQAVDLASRYGMDGVNGLIDEFVRKENLYLFGDHAWKDAGAKPPRAKKPRPRAAAPDPLDTRRAASLLGQMAAMTPQNLVAAWEKLGGAPMTFPDREALAAADVLAIISLAGDMRARFDAAKRERAALDFEDLERLAWALLARNPGGLLDALRRRLRRLLVDEFQDTSPVQWEIIRMIAGEDFGARLFIVGDPQQSIFGFRNADLRLFSTAESVIRAANAGVKDGGTVAMNDNFRSRPEILDFVNAAMPAMQGVAFDSGDLPGGPLRELGRQFQVAHLPMVAKSKRPAPGGIHLIIHARKAAMEDGEEPEHTMEAEIIARRILALVAGDAPQRLPGPDGALRPAQFGDVAILVRTRDEFRAFETAFLQYDIPFHIIGGRGFFQTPEITDISLLLTVLGDPQDNIALAGVLRSPLFAFTDALLLRLTLAAPGEAQTLWERLTAYEQSLAAGRAPEVEHPARRGERLPIAAPSDQAGEEARLVRLAVENITRWREAVMRRPLPALLHEIFEETGAWALYRGGNRHEQSVANLQKLIGLARAFESGGAGALLEFVENLATLTREEEEEAEAQTEAVQSNAVHLMTMHQAKGLEFPIVFAPRLGRQMTHFGRVFQATPDIGAALRAIDPGEEKKLEKSGGPVCSAFGIVQAWDNHKELMEELRLFYVVCTRAEQHLFLSSSWLRHMPRPPDEGPAKSLLGLMMQAPEFAEVFQWLVSAAGANEGGACDTMHAKIGGAALTVEWWRRIEGGGAARVGDEKDDSKAAPAFFTEERLAAIRPLRLPAGEVRLSVSQAAMITGCPRQWAYYQLLGPAVGAEEWAAEDPLPAEEDRGAASGGEDAESETVPPLSAPAREAGDGRKDYGIVCHKVFELFLQNPEAGDDDLIARAFRLASPHRDGRAREAWGGDLRANLAAFRASALGRAILASGERHAELPFFLRRDGLMVRGIIDALYRDAAGRWAAADYKTSRIAAENIPRSAARYGPQMALTAAFILARFPEQDAVTATLYYPFPDRAVPMEFRREDLEADLADAAAAWRAILTAGDLGAFERAPEWMARPQFPRSLARLASSSDGRLSPAPRTEPCPSCPFLERWCDLPADQRRTMQARRAARRQGEQQG